MKLFYYLAMLAMIVSMPLLSENADEKEEQKITDSALKQEILIALKNAALHTSTGIVYLGKGVFYVSRGAAYLITRLMFITIKSGVKIASGIFIGIPKTIFKVAFYMSGGYALLAVLDVANRLAHLAGLRSVDGNKIRSVRPARPS
jgi:hypothetical protein